MKHPVARCVALICTLLVIGAAEPKGGAMYQQLEQGDEKAKHVIRLLEDVQIADVSFENHTVGEAMSYLNRKVVGEKRGGVINVVIQGMDEVKNVAMTRKSVTFAQAVDAICRQSGRLWKIDFNETTGAPVLVIKNKNGR